jgi:hypothetical protein
VVAGLETAYADPREPAALESFDRLAVQALGGLAVAEQRARPSLGVERPVRPGRVRSSLEAPQGGSRLDAVASPLLFGRRPVRSHSQRDHLHHRKEANG